MIRLVRTVLGPCRRPDPTQINQRTEKDLVLAHLKACMVPTLAILLIPI